MVNAVSNYNEWVASLNSRGIKTTSLGANEANFADYTNALSESLKQEIAASFDTAADYDLQSKLASLLNGKNLMQATDIGKILQGTGMSYSVQYVNTSYIVDNKKGGQYSNNKNATNGSVAVYTFKDANGGEIKIADANGNGALESEELFMNELLSGVVSDIQAGGLNGAGAAQNTQNNMQAQIDALLVQMQEQIEEQQKMIEEQIAKLRDETIASLNKPLDVEETEINKPEAKDEDNKAEIRKEAKKLIENENPTLSDAEIDKMLDKVVDKVTTTDISVEKAVNTVLAKME